MQEKLEKEYKKKEMGKVGEKIQGETFSSSKLLHDLRIYISKSDLTRR